MRVDRKRTKKLRVAFHFQFSNPAAWRCDECRRAGLEKKRRCGWLRCGGDEGRVVWARERVATRECPKSFITAESAAWLEEFQVWKRIGFPDAAEMPARKVEAMVVLEAELAEEVKRGQQ